MLTREMLSSIDTDMLSAAAKELKHDDIEYLVELLAEKEDKLRYNALLLLQTRSRISEDVYPYWENFLSKLRSVNSYQRNIGILMIAANVRWDRKKLFEKSYEDYLHCLQDEKPITIRQCIQSLSEIIPYTLQLNTKIAQVLTNIDLQLVRETMRKLILLDILEILMQIRSFQQLESIDHYISDALMGDILDKKSKKYMEGLL